MPKLPDQHNHICDYCGATANYVSINSKKYRCVEKITQCRGVVQQMENSRQKNMSTEARRAHMKRMSENGNNRLRELNKNPEWVKRKSQKISERLMDRGGHTGSHNPMYGKSHSAETRKKQKAKAQNRDTTFYVKMVETRIQNGNAIPKHLLSHKELYEEAVMRETYNSWRSFGEKINPQNLERGKNYELDHIYSVAQGLIDNVAPEIIGHWCNLRLIPTKQNRRKHMKCDITLPELLSRIRESEG